MKNEYNPFSIYLKHVKERFSILCLYKYNTDILHLTCR